MAQPKLAVRPPPAAPPSSGTFRIAPPRSVVLYPAPVLRVPAIDADPCEPATVATAFALVAKLRVTPKCYGLSAPQLGESVRVMCVDVSRHPQARSCSGLVVLVNPVIMARSETTLMREECLSIPHLAGEVARPAEVIVEGAEPGTGRRFEVWADGVEARWLQHELDHLDGLCFADRVADPSRDLVAIEP